MEKVPGQIQNERIDLISIVLPFVVFRLPVEIEVTFEPRRKGTGVAGGIAAMDEDSRREEQQKDEFHREHVETNVDEKKMSRFLSVKVCRKGRKTSSPSSSFTPIIHANRRKFCQAEIIFSADSSILVIFGDKSRMD